MKTLAGFAAVGKPVVIEETFALKCSLDFNKFLDGTKQDADGWIGFYWGKTLLQLKEGKTFVDALLRSWLEDFQTRGVEFRRP